MNNFWTLVTIARRNILRNRRRSAFCVTASAIAVFFIIFMQSWIAGMVSNIHDVVRTFDTGDVNIVSADYDAQSEYLPVQFPVSDGKSFEGLKAGIEAERGVKAVFPRIMTFATLQDSTVKHALLWGIDIERETAFQDFNKNRRDDGLVEGRYPAPGKNECAIGYKLAEKMGAGIGSHIPLKTVSAQFSDKMWNPVITGIFNFDYLKYDDGVLIVRFERLQRLLTLDDGTQQMFVYTENPKTSAETAGALAALLGSGDVVHDWRDNYFVALMEKSMLVYALVYVVFIVVASFLIVNTMIMIIHERIKEIGMMGSLGMTRSEIALVFFLEAFLLSAAGALAGCIAGGAASFVMSFFPLDFNMLTGGGMKEMPVSGTLRLKFDWLILLQGFLLGVGVSSVCTLIPSLKSAFTEPVEALRR
ncbi:MAG: FtsX-like permease family protein [Spirochaetaceae bacterium]|jgi:putative ABC transport system permease protein|nr:FtsX-like permease family protein [Spirochaetaceae bacterium]